MYTLARERLLPSSSGSVWKGDSCTRRMRVRELLRDKCLNLFMPIDIRSECQVSNNNSTQKKNIRTMVDTLKNDRKFREFYRPTDEWLIDQENKEYFNKTYG